MAKLFILLNILPTFLTALELFTYYIVIDGTYSRYPNLYPKLCPLFGHIGHSVKKLEMTALRAGDEFPEGIHFRYALHAAPTAAVHLLSFSTPSLQLGTLHRREGDYHILRHSSDIQRQQEVCRQESSALRYVFSEFIFPLLDQVLSLETCLVSFDSVDMFQGSMQPLE